MRFDKITLSNFRQFRGTQRIDLSGEDDGKNVTVIFGENGRGKTGIFRAIMFCLYGEGVLSQDQEVDKKEMYLVNRVELFDGIPGKPVECSVEIEFSHKQEKYIIRRGRRGLVDDGNVIEEEIEPTLTIRKSDGNAKILTEVGEIQEKINSILDPRVREYFLFDGEKIERLTRASSEQRKEISKGIRNLLNIDSLERAHKALKILTKKLSNEVPSNVNTEYAQVIQKINQNKERQESIRGALSKVQEEIELAETEITQIDNKLDEIKEIKQFIFERKELESRIRTRNEELQGLLTEIKAKNGLSGILIVRDLISEVFSNVSLRKERGEIPSEVRRDLIDRILRDNLCICGRPINENPECLRQIIQYKNRSNELVVEDSMLELWRHLSGVRDRIEIIESDALSCLQRYGVQRNEIEKLTARLEEIKAMIGDERADAGDLDKQRENIIGKIGRLNQQTEQIQTEIGILESEHESLISLRAEKEREGGIKNEILRRADLAQKTRDALERVYSEFTQEIKCVIGKAATEYFQELIDEEGRKNLAEITVNSDYSLQILDQWKKPFLANISAGQRQIMSISFIAALARVANKSEKLEVPLFMDTPFGRLSYSHRRNLLAKIPEYTTQWILLATDTEFRKPEAQMLRKSNRWGRFFRLKSFQPGETVVEEIPLGKVSSILNDYSEENEK